MEDQKVSALFIGGNADGRTTEIERIEPRLECHGSFYVFRDALRTRKLGVVQMYVLEGMPLSEERKRLEIIEKSL